ncbi:hypothetical protein AMS68_007555 [Peltaster fructicola]|uniref:C3H1-type domain-containing protein n=1 Tax=Peltaster fructicola TaxID=286661 RepID=A0A6H0Y5C0_9PEZI|nr:hypothetical protein AMS68_007555 [Peltaster fructicola]
MACRHDNDLQLGPDPADETTVLAEVPLGDKPALLVQWANECVLSADWYFLDDIEPEIVKQWRHTQRHVHLGLQLPFDLDTWHRLTTSRSVSPSSLPAAALLPKAAEDDDPDDDLSLMLRRQSMLRNRLSTPSFANLPSSPQPSHIQAVRLPDTTEDADLDDDTTLLSRRQSVLCTSIDNTDNKRTTKAADNSVGHTSSSKAPSTTMTQKLSNTINDTKLARARVTNLSSNTIATEKNKYNRRDSTGKWVAKDQPAVTPRSTAAAASGRRLSRPNVAQPAKIGWPKTTREKDPDPNALTFIDLGESAAEKQVKYLQEYENQIRRANPAANHDDVDRTRQPTTTMPPPKQPMLLADLIKMASQSTRIDAPSSVQEAVHTDDAEDELVVLQKDESFGLNMKMLITPVPIMAYPGSYKSTITCKFWFRFQKGVASPCRYANRCIYAHAMQETPLQVVHIATSASAGDSDRNVEKGKAEAILITDDVFANRPRLAIGLLQCIEKLAAQDVVQNRPRRVIVTRPYLRDYLRALVQGERNTKGLSAQAALYLDYLRACPDDNMDESRHTLFTHPYTDHHHIVAGDGNDGLPKLDAVQQTNQLVRGFVLWLMKNTSTYSSFIVVHEDWQTTGRVDPRGWMKQYLPYPIFVTTPNEFIKEHQR